MNLHASSSETRPICFLPRFCTCHEENTLLMASILTVQPSKVSPRHEFRNFRRCFRMQMHWISRLVTEKSRAMIRDKICPSETSWRFDIPRIVFNRLCLSKSNLSRFEIHEIYFWYIDRKLIEKLFVKIKVVDNNFRNKLFLIQWLIIFNTPFSSFNSIVHNWNTHYPLIE